MVVMTGSASVEDALPTERGWRFMETMLTPGKENARRALREECSMISTLADRTDRTDHEWGDMEDSWRSGQHQ